MSYYTMHTIIIIYSAHDIHILCTHTHCAHSRGGLQDGTHMKRLERLCDAVVRLEAFAGSDKEQNPLYKDYHGESRLDSSDTLLIEHNNFH